MLIAKKITFVLIALGLLQFPCAAQNNTAQFTENLGQWEDFVQYRADIPNGFLYLEHDQFTYSLYDHEALEALHGTGKALPDFIDAHAYRVKFLDANNTPAIEVNERSSDYKNFFLGSDPERWASNVYSYQQVLYGELYDGVDMKIYTQEGSLKYDFILQPGIDPDQIRLEYEGVDDLELTPWGDLHVGTTVGEIIEKHPYAYQLINGKEKEVECRFVLADNILSFDFPDGYNRKYELVIDPVLVFSTYTGSTANNFGCTATYDNAGNMYTGGTVFGAGYPVTAGAYQVTFGAAGAGTIDMGITKFNATGTSLLYSTYLGGSASETPHSIVVNDNNELFILGTAGDNTFPTTAGAYQPTFGGGIGIVWTVGYGFSHPGGSDITVSKLSADGTTLMASTFVGGTGNEGLNVTSLLDYNYGDPFRGEIIVDANSDVYVASCSESTDFPVTAGAPQPTSGGMRDGVVFKLSSDLSSLLWSTYVGGSENDNAYSVQLSSTGDVFATGGTLSNDFPAQPGAMSPAFGGTADGFVVKINPTGTSFLAATYIGTPAYDQTYFVQLDQSDFVYVLGQSEGTYLVSGPVYNNANSGQFVLKMQNDLSAAIWSTTVGTGSGAIDISPTAFLVNNCGHLYIAGWGGTTNLNNGHALSSTTNGLPITAGAYQNTTDGSDFYLMVLDVDASGIIYATYFGGGISAEHVDGGTSRFDKNGIVYQAVCAGCGGNDDFPSTPGAWSAVNNSSCNLGAFKFDLNDIVASISFNVITGTCAFPIEVEFNNTSTGAIQYFWDYGDGGTSTVFDGSHFYSDPGTYDIILIATDSNTCMIADTAYAQITIPEPIEPIVQQADTICAGSVMQLDATTPGIDEYLWSPGSSLSSTTEPDPFAFPDETTTYTVTVTDTNGCESSASATAVVYSELPVDAGPDIYLDFGYDAQVLNATIPPGYNIEWSPPDGLSCTDCPNPIASPDETTTYYLLVTDEYGCSAIDTVTVYVWPSLYIPNAFTPNEDSKNPIFYAYGTGIAFFEMTIYTRWGELIWKTEDLSVGWDGRINGIMSPNDVYVWRIEYSTDMEPEEFKTALGHVTLVR